MVLDVERHPKMDERRARQDRRAQGATDTKVRGRKRPVGTKAAAPEHAVFLIPGLLGFERFTTFSYFADRVVSALRAGLERALGQLVPVIPLPIPPTASLRNRQMKLVKSLADRLHALEHEYKPLRVHLVGHSTGGVDALLLTHQEPVGGGSWSDVDPRARVLRERIRSVVTIASPHQGACIARDPVARLKSQRDLRGLPGLTSLLGKFALTTMSDVEIGDFLTNAYREAGKSYRFLADVLSRWDLLEDLQPSRISNGSDYRHDVVRRSFVTVAGRPKPGAGTSRPADTFFRELSARASGWNTGSAEQGELVQASVERLRRALATEPADDLVISAAGVDVPEPIDAGHNDGVVNSARQLVDPDDHDELAGIVVGDHFDVVGYYDRHVWRVGDDGHERSTQVVSGLLHSGSGFRDREFFELYRRVASAIADAAQA